MAGPPPATAKGPNLPQRMSTRSQSRTPVPAPSPTTPQNPPPPPRPTSKDSSTKESNVLPKENLSDGTQPPSAYKIIADGIRGIIVNYKPSDQVRLALAEVLGYVTKAAAEETNKRAEKNSQAEIERNLLNSSQQLGKAAERLETVATEIQTKLAAVSNTTTQLETTAKTYKDALLKAPVQTSYTSERHNDLPQRNSDQGEGL
ncbi:hypothetical protein F5888DRAFT_1637890 [Russula emetica]|nr:hypothetical protein F5888DRAFT_1638522 [Russula emetica]KAF8490770.1 hypothetical protein F5888DRAFT_1637890 [Russula emetica]